MEEQNTPLEEQEVIQTATMTDINSTKRTLVPISFVAVLVFFFFNFFVIKCSNEKIGEVTGINLVTGTQLKSKDMFTGAEKNGEKIPSNTWAIIAFASAIIGLGTFLIKVKKEEMIGAAVGVAGVISLIVLQTTVKNSLEQRGQSGMITASFELGYWGAMIALSAATVLCILLIQDKNKLKSTV